MAWTDEYRRHQMDHAKLLGIAVLRGNGETSRLSQWLYECARQNGTVMRPGIIIALALTRSPDMQTPQPKAASSAAYSIVAHLGPSSQAQVRCYDAGAPLFAALTREFPGHFARWEFHPAADGDGFNIKNVGLAGFVAIGEDGALVVASDGADRAEFRVLPGEDGSVLLEHRADPEVRVWSVQGEGVRANIVMQAADGSFKQKFTRVAIEG